MLLFFFFVFLFVVHVVLKYLGPERKVFVLCCLFFLLMCLQMDWAKHFITEGLTAIEAALASSAGKFCVGDEPSVADFCLIPQVYNAKRYGVDLSLFPTIVRINDSFEKLPFAIAAHPNAQPDFDPEAK
jgi:maleylacetoacetate isomerase